MVSPSDASILSLPLKWHLFSQGLPLPKMFQNYPSGLSSALFPAGQSSTCLHIAPVVCMALVLGTAVHESRCVSPQIAVCIHSILHTTP